MESRSIPQSIQNYLERGTQWLAFFRERKIDFVGEIQIDEAELDDLCRAIRLRLDRSDEEFSALLTVVVVNLAYYAPESFIEHVQTKIVGNQNQLGFARLVGSRIEQALKKYFHVKPRNGPYRYVTPIKQQAGIPASAESRFISRFCDLLRQHGFDFTADNYQNFLHQVATPTVNDFLDSDTGRHFCRDLARILRNRQDDVFDARAFPNQPRFGTLVEKVWRRIQTEKPNDVRRLPSPKLILDLNSKRLAIEFAARGLNGGYSWEGGTLVGRILVFLEPDDFRQGLKGLIHQPDKSTEVWTVNLWQPTDCHWAAFRGGDGSYVNQKEKLQPGHYLLVVPEDIPLPCSAEIFGEYGWLQLPIPTVQSFVIFDCELPPGFEIPEIGLAVGTDPGLYPTLEFLSDEALPFTRNVFIGRLPEVRIYDWSSEFTQRFFILTDNSQQREIVTPTDDKFRFSPPQPSQGEIRIEPRGRTPRGFVSQGLRYTLLAPKARVELPRGLLAIGEESHIEFHPPQDFQVSWEDERIKPSGSGCWCVPADVEFVEGQVTYQSCLSFPIYGTIYRFKISGSIIKDRVLWRENFTQKSKLTLRFSRKEIGQQVELGLLAKNSLSQVLTLSRAVPNSATLTISTEEIRDAVTDSPLTAAEIVVRLPSHRTKTSSRVFASRVIYINEQKLVESLCQDEALSFEGLLTILPTGLEKLIESTRELRHAATANFKIQVESLPFLLQSFIKQLAVCREVFDLKIARADLSLLADGKLRETLNWVQNAKEFLADAQPSSAQVALALHEQMPRNLSVIPFERWREECRAIEERLRQIKDWQTLIREWAGHCRQESWRAARNTQLGQMPGGTALTDGAKDYFYALERKANGQKQGLMNWFGAARSQFQQAQNEAGQGIILEIASALQAMTFYHAGHQVEFQNKAKAAIGLLSPQWSQFCRTLQHLQQPTQQRHPNDGTLGLAAMSPHPIDIELEERIK